MSGGLACIVVVGVIVETGRPEKLSGRVDPKRRAATRAKRRLGSPPPRAQATPGASTVRRTYRLAGLSRAYAEEQYSRRTQAGKRRMAPGAVLNKLSASSSAAGTPSRFRRLVLLVLLSTLVIYLALSSSSSWSATTSATRGGGHADGGAYSPRLLSARPGSYLSNNLTTGTSDHLDLDGREQANDRLASLRDAIGRHGANALGGLREKAHQAAAAAAWRLRHPAAGAVTTTEDEDDDDNEVDEEEEDAPGRGSPASLPRLGDLDVGGGDDDDRDDGQEQRIDWGEDAWASEDDEDEDTPSAAMSLANLAACSRVITFHFALPETEREAAQGRDDGARTLAHELDAFVLAATYARLARAQLLYDDNALARFGAFTELFHQIPVACQPNGEWWRRDASHITTVQAGALFELGDEDPAKDEAVASKLFPAVLRADARQQTVSWLRRELLELITDGGSVPASATESRDALRTLTHATALQVLVPRQRVRRLVQSVLSSLRLQPTRAYEVLVQRALEREHPSTMLDGEQAQGWAWTPGWLGGGSRRRAPVVLALGPPGSLLESAARLQTRAHVLDERRSRWRSRRATTVDLATLVLERTHELVSKLASSRHARFDSKQQRGRRQRRGMTLLTSFGAHAPLAERLRANEERHCAGGGGGGNEGQWLCGARVVALAPPRLRTVDLQRYPLLGALAVGSATSSAKARVASAPRDAWLAIPQELRATVGRARVRDWLLAIVTDGLVTWGDGGGDDDAQGERGVLPLLLAREVLTRARYDSLAGRDAARDRGA